jgi:Ca2+:H+ antiporter
VAACCARRYDERHALECLLVQFLNRTPMSVSDEQDSGFTRSLQIATALLLVVPVAPILKYFVGAAPVWVFAAGAVAIGVLADWIRRATEQAAKSLGPAIGGLMTVSFGSIAEIVLALFVLASGKAEVVKAQITSSILGTSLLGLGLAIMVGTLGREQLRFKRERAGLLSSLLILAVIALLLPAVFDVAQRMLAGAPRKVDEQDLSLGVSIVLIALYAANLVYTLVTRRDVFAPDEPRETEGAWPMALSIGVLVGAHSSRLRRKRYLARSKPPPPAWVSRTFLSGSWCWR